MVPLDARVYIAGWVGITATANPGYQFLSWSGVTSGTRNPEATLVDRPSSLTAHFSGPPGVTVTTNPAGLSMSVDGVAYTSPHTFAWPPGSVHTIAAVSYDLSGTRYLFQNWSDAGAATHTITTPVTALTLTAGFTLKYKLTMATDPPEAGSIALGVPRDADGYVSPGWMLITATANPGYQFLSWSGVASGIAQPRSHPGGSAQFPHRPLQRSPGRHRHHQSGGPFDERRRRRLYLAAHLRLAARLRAHHRRG